MRLGKFVKDRRPGAFFVAGIGVGKQIADGNRGHALFAEFPGRLTDGSLIQRMDLVAFPADPAGNFPRHALRCDRLRLLVEIIERVAVAGLGLNFLHRTVAFGDHQPDARAPHLKQRIRRDRRAVAEEFDGARRRSFGDKIIDAVQHAKGRIGRRRGYFLDRNFTRFHIEQNKVSMSAADVDAEAIAGIRCHYVTVGMRPWVSNNSKPKYCVFIPTPEPRHPRGVFEGRQHS